jgi:hypothetical protein
MKNLPDLSGVTLRDLKDLEHELGRPIGAVLSGLAGGDMSNIDADVLAGLVWIRLRRDEPAITLAQVWELDLSAFDEELDSKKAPSSPARNRSTRSQPSSPERGGARPSRSAT